MFNLISGEHELERNNSYEFCALSLIQDKDKECFLILEYLDELGEDIIVKKVQFVRKKEDSREAEIIFEDCNVGNLHLEERNYSSYTWTVLKETVIQRNRPNSSLKQCVALVEEQKKRSSSFTHFYVKEWIDPGEFSCMDIDPEQRPTFYKGRSRENLNSLIWSNALLKKMGLSYPNSIPLKIKINNSKKARMELVHMYCNKIDLYLENRKKRSPNQYIGRLDRFFGGCSLIQKELAVNALKQALIGEINLEELENIHSKALNQGNLGNLYKEIKASLMINSASPKSGRRNFITC